MDAPDFTQSRLANTSRSRRSRARSAEPAVSTAWCARRVPAIVSGMQDHIRVAVVDDHAAIRLGLTAAIDAQPGMVCAGVAADADEAHPLLHRTRPDVVVLDYHLPRVDGLELCRRIKSDVL